MRAPTATGVFPPNMSAGLSARSRSCVTSQVSEAILRAIFAPGGHRHKDAGCLYISGKVVSADYG